MIKAIILTCLIAFCAAQSADDNTHYEVIVFRGQMPLLTAQMNFNEINQRGIVLKDVKKSELSEENEDAWKSVVYEEGELNVVLPLRRTSMWSMKSTAYLGTLLQSIYRCDNGDEFQVSLAFGLCNNSYNIEDFQQLLDNLEAKRQNNYALLAALFGRVKKEADAIITSRNTLDDLTDDHVDNNKRMDELKAKNAGLIADLRKLSGEIHTKEELEFKKEMEASEKCSSSRISHSTVTSLKHHIASYETQKKVLEDQLENSNAFSEQEKANYLDTRREVLDSVVRLTEFNKKVEAFHVVEGKAIDPEDLRPFFYNN
jgi:hypothetical protein